MGRIVTSVTIENLSEPGTILRCDVLVDTGASHLVLPVAWRSRLGNLTTVAEVELELANQQAYKGEICGPVRIQIEGFRSIYSEVLFIPMNPENGIYEPLLGYIPLEQSQAGIDMVGHRLVQVKRLDLKKIC